MIRDYRYGDSQDDKKLLASENVWSFCPVKAKWLVPNLRRLYTQLNDRRCARNYGAASASAVRPRRSCHVH